MAEVKKTVAKAVATTAPAKAEVKEEVKVEAKAEPKTPAKKTAAKKPAAAKKETVKKAAVKKEAPARKAAAKKAEIVETVNFQFSGKSYTPESLLKSCKDVWKYDLGGKEEDLKSVELYVKPEENTTYYVINGEITGSFFI